MPPINTGSKKRNINDQELPYVFNLCVGEYEVSQRPYEHVTFRCNLTKNQLKEAHNIGSQICEFNLAQATQNRSSIDKEHIGRLQEKGIDMESTEIEMDEEEGILGTDSYCNLWLEIAKLGNPELKWQREKIDIYVGGQSLTEY